MFFSAFWSTCQWGGYSPPPAPPGYATGWSRGLKAKDTKNIRGQGQRFRAQTLTRPRTQAPVFSEKKRSSKQFFRRSQKKRSLKIFFKRSPVKNVFQKFFSADLKNFIASKKVLSSSRGRQFSRTRGQVGEDGAQWDKNYII